MHVWFPSMKSRNNKNNYNINRSTVDIAAILFINEWIQFVFFARFFHVNNVIARVNQSIVKCQKVSQIETKMVLTGRRETYGLISMVLRNIQFKNDISVMRGKGEIMEHIINNIQPKQITAKFIYLCRTIVTLKHTLHWTCTRK